MHKSAAIKRPKRFLGTGTSGKLSLKSSSSVVLRKIIGISGLPIAFLAERVFEVTPKTLTKYRDHSTKIPALLTEHALNFLEMYKLGLEMFGSHNNFNVWLMSSNIGLGFDTPAEIMNTSGGIERIFEVLKRIEFGATA